MFVRFFDAVTHLAVRFRWITIAIAVVGLTLGVLAMTDLNLEMLPRIEFPQTVVVAQWPDSDSSEQFLNQVTKPLEEKLSAIDGVVNVESNTSSAFAFIIVRNDFGLNQDRLLTDIETAVSDTTLPDGMETPQVLNFSLSDLPVVVASVSSSNLTLSELKDLVQTDMEPQLEKIEQVSRVTVGGGQELPDETVAEAAPTPEPTATPDPSRLPLVVTQGAKALGVEIEYAQDVTPDVLAGLGGTDEQVLQVLKMIPPETLRYAPPETLALLPIEYMASLDTDLLAQLDGLAAEFGGVSQYTIAQARAILNGADPASVVQVEPTPAATPEPEQVVEETAVPEITPIPLPDSWITAAAAAGFDLKTTADITPEVMAGIAGFAPELLNDITPEMWRALDPAAVAPVLAGVSETLDAQLVTELNALQLAAAGEALEPAALPESWVTMAAGAGFTLETTADVPAAAMEQLVGFAPQLLDDLTPEILLAFAPEVQAALPPAYVASLDDGLQQTLANIGIYTAQLQTAAAETGSEMPGMEPVALPETWIAGAAQLGQEIATTADITPEFMGAILNFAPEQLAELTPEMWRALSPDVIALAMPAAGDGLDAPLAAQLTAITQAAAGLMPEPAALPESWVTMAAGAGFTLETTADVPAAAMEQLAGFAPQLLADLTPDVLLAFGPDTLAVLPMDYVTSLDADLQQTLTAVAVANAQFQASQIVVEGEGEATPEPEIDPARLPDMLIQGAQAFGADIEFAQDLTPELLRPLAAAGPQAAQFFQLLTPDNLRLMPAESIALLPMEFLDTLDADLRSELDGLAAEWGGAGQLAVQEAEERAAASADAPALSGIWLEPGPNGEEPLFKTAADILNNPFTPGAAVLLNSLPTQSERPAELAHDLTPEVITYLADNEEGFIENLELPFLELMSPETLTFMLESYPDALDADTTTRLAGIAAGTVKAFVPEASITRTDGDPAVIVSLYKDGDANTVEVAHRIFDTLDAYTASNPDLKTSLVFEQATFIEDSIAGVSREGALGAVFAIVVILIFLSGHVSGKYRLSWRATVVTGVSIPLSVFTALLLMRWVPPTIGVWVHDLADSSGNGIIGFIAQLFPRNITLNIMTLSGLTVAIGRVVDDSIVVLENTYRFIQRGDDPMDAVFEGTKEVAIAIFSATATTVAVFLPLGLIGGIIGSFFLPFGLTVTYALAASFIVAITVVPALTYLMIRKKHIPEERETTMQRWYTPVLVWALGHRFYTMIIATVIFLTSLFMLGQLPQSFIPSIGEPTINVSVNLPRGTTMAETNDLVAEFETAVADVEGIESLQTEIGSGGGVEAFFGGSGVSQNIANLTISASMQDDLTVLTNEVRQEAESVFGSDYATVSAASQTGFGGFTLVLTGDNLEVLREEVPVAKEALASVDLDGDGIQDIANVGSNVDGSDSANGDGMIIRIDGRPAISFTGDLETENTLGVTAAAKAAIEERGLPAGVEVTEGFDSQQQVEGFRSMVTAILYSIVIVYLIMALTFRSFIHPFTILFSLPFALVGAALALWLTNSVLGISAMIGMMMLVGIVVTNGIVLMELVQQLRHQGKNAYDALVEGGRTRLRPIWMTALAAILALIPLGVSGEAGAIIASELARAVMGGLLVSTLLTLVVIPVVYSLFDSLTSRLSRKS